LSLSRACLGLSSWFCSLCRDLWLVRTWVPFVCPSYFRESVLVCFSACSPVLASSRLLLGLSLTRGGVKRSGKREVSCLSSFILLRLLSWLHHLVWLSSSHVAEFLPPRVPLFWCPPPISFRGYPLRGVPWPKKVSCTQWLYAPLCPGP